ncbi:MAG: amidohydrolase family protein [Nitrososphaerales archaeon]
MSSHLETILRNCNIIDVASGSILLDKDLLVASNQFKEISSHLSKKDNETEIDMEGAYLLPGLVNVHVNLSHDPHANALIESELETTQRCYKRALEGLTAGVTTIRTVGEIHRVDLALRKKINQGLLKGPRIVAGGKGLSSSTPGALKEGHSVASNPEEFRKAAEAELSLGADHLKIYATGGISGDFQKPIMSTGDVEAVVSAAKSRNTYVAAHCGGSKAAAMLADAGVRSIEHAYELDVDAAKILKEKGCYLVPTLGVTRSPTWFEMNGFPAQVLDRLLSFKKMHMESARIAHRQGVQLLNGVDMPPGDICDGINVAVREMQFLIEAGLTPIEAIQASTIRGAELCGLGSKVGLIKENYLADLIAVQGNPLVDIRSMEEILFVLKDGEVIKNSIM